MAHRKKSTLAIGAGVTSAVLVGAGLATAPAAQAVDPCGTAFVFFYRTPGSGAAQYSFTSSRKTLDGYRFACGGEGQGVSVKNNARSAGNNTGYAIVRVYFNSYCQGPSDAIGRGSWSTLRNTYRDNASFRFEGAGYNCSR